MECSDTVFYDLLDAQSKDHEDAEGEPRVYIEEFSARDSVCSRVVPGITHSLPPPAYVQLPRGVLVRSEHDRFSFEHVL